nr:hypothetical protein BDOA9_0153130 [Bradyrhizobium sp. DOA9]
MRNCFPVVIASAAKQSRVSPRKDSGLLRCARNDVVAASLFNSHLPFADTLPHPRGASRPSFVWWLRPQWKRAQGRPGAGRAPTVHCAKGGNKNLHSGIQVKPNIRPSLRRGK